MNVENLKLQELSVEEQVNTEGGFLPIVLVAIEILGGMSVKDVSQKAIANLGWTDIKMPSPLFVGDTLYAESEVLEKRESKSRPNAGIVTIKTIGKNQHGKIVCEYKRTILIPKTGHAVEDKIDY